MEKWYKKSFFRNLVDMHIPDSDPTYLSKFDAEEYARLVSLSGVDTAILYTSNCLGYTFFEEEQMHGNMKNRDFVGERIEAFKKYGVRTILYYNIWNREAALCHPDWNLVNPRVGAKKERFRRNCLNSEGFRAYVKRQLETLSHKYKFEGIWIDMIDWFDTLCVCPACRKKLMAEEGIEIPERVDYTDEKFAKYRIARERWLCEFIDLVRDAVHSGNPDATVTLQNAAWRRGLDTGISEESVKRSEFLAGDFYADPLMYSVICKFINNATENRPVEFMTSVCSQLEAHTTSKTDKELLRTMHGALAHNTAFTFIDAIDPIGTMNPTRYERMRRLGEKTKRERENLSPDAKLISDVTLYLNHDSIFEYTNKPLTEYCFEGKIAKGLTNFAEAMIEKHISYDINARKNIEKIDSPTLFLADLRILNEREVSAIKKYVEEGGTLIATAMTGTLRKEGGELDDFALSDVLGVHLVGKCDTNPTYIRRANPAVKEFADYDEGYPIAVLSDSVLVKAEDDVEVLGYLTKPISSSTDTEVFSSAISDPPVIDTDFPAVTRRRVGKGQAIYVSAPIESSLHADGRGLLTSLILSAGKRNINATAPDWLEIVAYSDDNANRYIINCVNTMCRGYEATVPEAKIKLKTDKMITKAYNITTNTPVSFEMRDGEVVFSIKDIDNYAMVTLEY